MHMAIFSHTTGYATEHRKRTRKRLRTKHGRSHTRARVSRRVRIKRPKMRAPSPRWARAAHLRRRRRHAVSRVRTCATGHAAALHGARCGCGANARRLPLHGTRHAEHHADHVTCALRCILHVGQFAHKPMLTEEVHLTHRRPAPATRENYARQATHKGRERSPRAREWAWSISPAR